MSRKLVLTLVALGTLTSAALVAESANAKAGHGGNHGGIHMNHGGALKLQRVPNRPHVHVHHRHHRYVWWRHRHLHPVGYIAGGYVARAATQGPCTCLTKEYTPDGIVVFRDLCTKEMASGPVDGAPTQSGQATDPNNFAGKTYQDYLAANQQAK